MIKLNYYFLFLLIYTKKYIIILEQIQKISYNWYRRNKRNQVEKKSKDVEINILIDAFNYFIKNKNIMIDKKDMILVFDKNRRYATLLLRIKAKGKCRQ